MKHFLVIADPYGSPQRVLTRALDLAGRFGARLTIVGFVHEHLANLSARMSEAAVESLKEALIERHRQSIEARLARVGAGEDVERLVEVVWEKRIAEWITRRAQEQRYDAVVKGGHRSETFLYTPTDWQLLRNCRIPVLLLAERRWRRARHVMAAVDLGTRVASKRALNHEIVREAAAMAEALGVELHVGYVVPYSQVLNDLVVLDKGELRREGLRAAEEFARAVRERGIAVRSVDVRVGLPERALVDLTAKHRVGLVVLGCVGRRRLAGRVLGNTAEKILRLVRADVLAIKP